MPPLFVTQGLSRTPVHWLGVKRHEMHTCPTTFDHVNQRPPSDRGPLRRGPRSRFVDSVPSEAGGVATASTMPLRALENQLGSSNCYTTEAVLLKTRGGNLQLLSCKVSCRSHDVRESCRRPNMEKKTPPRHFPAIKFPAKCKPSQPVQHVWVHTTPTVVLACVIG